MGAVTVLVVDDHAVVVQGLGHVLHQVPGTTVVGLATTAAGALQEIDRLCPDVVLLDHVLPDGLGLDLAPTIRRRHPHTAVVLLSGVLDDELAAAALAAGCAAALHKSATPDEITAAVATAAAGVQPEHPRVARSGRFGLTPREVEILHCFSRGLSSKQISGELHLATDTVRNYTQKVLTRLGAHSKAEAVAIATRAGLLLD